MGDTKASEKKPKPPADESFGEHLRRLREEARLSIQEAAAASGFAPGDWMAMENDAATPRLRMLRAMAKTLGVEPQEVL
jgi:transcriptional regulator with XRE-family HTH domain